MWTKDEPAATRRTVIWALPGLWLAGSGLSACTETLSAVAGGDRPAASAIVAAPDVPISIESLDGGDPAFRARFTTALTDAATARKITLVGADGAPRFRLRGYLDAAKGADGKPALVWVYDIYDQSRQRARRLEGAAPGGGSGADPWAAIDAALVRRAAEESMNEVAGFLLEAGKIGPGGKPAGAQVAADL